VDDLKRQAVDKAELRSQLAELGFLSWLKMLDNEPPPDAAPAILER